MFKKESKKNVSLFCQIFHYLKPVEVIGKREKRSFLQEGFIFMVDESKMNNLRAFS